MYIIQDPYFYLVAIPAILLFGMNKGGFGGGSSAISIPLMALVIDPLTAAAIVLPILILMDLVAVWKFRYQWSRLHVFRLLPSAIIGITAASLLMGSLGADGIRISLGIIAILFCLKTWFLSELNLPKPGRWSACFWGAVTGYTSTQLHAGGIPINIYILPQKLNKMEMMGTLSIFFTAVNFIKIIPYTLLGQFDTSNLMMSVMLMPLAPIGVLLGYYLLKKVNQLWIYRIMYFVLFFAGIKILIDGLG